MNTVSMKEELDRTAVTTATRVKSGERFSSYKGGTIAFLLLSSAVSIYEAFCVSGAGSQFFIPLLAGGLGRLAVARFCLRGSRVAFVTASAFAIITSAIDILSSSGDYLNSALYVGPQILVVVFSILSLRQMRVRSDV